MVDKQKTYSCLSLRLSCSTLRVSRSVSGWLCSGCCRCWLIIRCRISSSSLGCCRLLIISFACVVTSSCCSSTVTVVISRCGTCTNSSVSSWSRSRLISRFVSCRSLGAVRSCCCGGGCCRVSYCITGLTSLISRSGCCGGSVNRRNCA